MTKKSKKSKKTKLTYHNQFADYEIDYNEETIKLFDHEGRCFDVLYINEIVDALVHDLWANLSINVEFRDANSGES